MDSSRHEMDRHSINFAQVCRLPVEHLLQARHSVTRSLRGTMVGEGGMSGWLLPGLVKRSLLEFRSEMCGWAWWERARTHRAQPA